MQISLFSKYQVLVFVQGERLSHAVGCAFAVCLEKKQRRDREVQMGIAVVTAAPQLMSSAADDAPPATAGTSQLPLARQGSLRRQASLTERMQDPQNVKPTEPPPPARVAAELPHAVARPQANPQLFERQGSLRTPDEAAAAFRRHYSLRMTDLPSTLARQQEMGGLPGARVSAIPEEGADLSAGIQNLGVAQDAHAQQKRRQRLVHAETVGASLSPPTEFDEAAAAGAGAGTEWNRRGSVGEMPLSQRSKAAEWLDKTLMATTGAAQGSRGSTPAADKNSPPTGPSPPAQNGYPPGYPSGPSPSLPLPPPLANQQPPFGQEADLFGQPKFEPRKAPPVGETRSMSMDGWRMGGILGNGQITSTGDAFDAKWNALARRREATNPFSAESDSVKI